MEGGSHDSISGVESLFDTITMVNIDIYIKDSGVYAVDQLAISIKVDELTVTTPKFLEHY
jgi:hypothetical protein